MKTGEIMSLERKQLEAQFWDNVEESQESYVQAINVLLKLVKFSDLRTLIDNIDDWNAIIWDEAEE